MVGWFSHMSQLTLSSLWQFHEKTFKRDTALCRFAVAVVYMCLISVN